MMNFWRTSIGDYIEFDERRNRKQEQYLLRKEYEFLLLLSVLQILVFADMMYILW